MKALKQNVGIEVDSQNLKVSLQILKEDLTKKILGSRTFKNNQTGFKALGEWIEKKRVSDCKVNLTMEATGVYFENLVYYFHEHSDYLLHVLLPSVSHSYARSLNQKSKTDEMDAKMLAQLGLERELAPWKPLSKFMRNLKRLHRERIQLIKEKTLVSNQLHAEEAAHDTRKDAMKRYKKRIQFITTQITEIEEELKKLVGQDPKLKQRIDHVCTSPGLGFITVVGIVAETNGFALFKNRSQLMSYAGYDVVKKESGTSVRGPSSISKKGNSFIRYLLYMPALSAVRFCEHHQAQYERILCKTSIKMKGNVAIQRKLLLQIYALFTKNEPYDPNYHAILREKLAAKNKCVHEELEGASI